MVKEPLINPCFVTPAQAGAQRNQRVMDSRLRGNDINQRFLIPRNGVRPLPEVKAFETVSARADFCLCKICISAIHGGQTALNEPPWMASLRVSKAFTPGSGRITKHQNPLTKSHSIQDALLSTGKATISQTLKLLPRRFYGPGDCIASNDGE